VTHDGSALAPESNSTVGAATVGGAPAGAKLAVGASSSQTQMGAAAPLSDDDDEFEVVMGRPCLQEQKWVSLPEEVGTTQSALHLVE
jgi:hypothetical protein